MIILGLTGSIGMGKSFVARAFSRLGVPVFDADKTVHELFERAATISKIKKQFPESFQAQRIDRKKLGELVIGDKEKIRKLEKIIHPLVRKAEKDFIKQQRAAREKICLLDIPLLFETGFEKFCDYVIVVHAPKHIQKARVLRRKKMTESQLSSIIKKQMPDAEKMRRADFVINTGLEKAAAIKQVREIYKTLCQI